MSTKCNLLVKICSTLQFTSNCFNALEKKEEEEATEPLTSDEEMHFSHRAENNNEEWQCQD